jgi:integrase
MRYPGVKRLKSGKYLVRATGTCPKTGKRKDTQKVIEAKSMAAAFQVREEMRIQLQSVSEVRPSRLRLGEYAESWMTSRLRELKPSTRTHYASVLDLHILPWFGDFYVDAITPPDVVRWRDAQKGLPRTVNSRLTVLRALLKSAHYELDLDRDPYGRTKEVSLDPIARKDFEPEELRAVLAWVREHEPRWYPLLVTLTFTACRFGEVAALTWGDVDWINGELTVSKSAWRGHVTTPKTGKVRRVPLIPPLAEVLRAHRVGQEPQSEEELIFRARGGAHHVPGGFAPILHRATEALRLPKRRGAAHRLRHSGNNLLRKVASGEVTRSITGHASSEMTWHYSHVGAHEKAAAMTRVYDLVVGGDQGVGDRVGDRVREGNVIQLFPRDH